MVALYSIGSNPRAFRINAATGAYKCYNFGAAVTYDSIWSTYYSAPYAVLVASSGYPWASKEIMRVRVDKLTPANPDVLQSWKLDNPTPSSDNLYVQDLFLETMDKVHLILFGTI